MEFDPLFTELCENGFAEQITAYLAKPECCGQVGHDFLGFTEIYRHLAEIIPKSHTVIDFGCAFGFQAWYFRNHAKYIGINSGSSGFFKIPAVKNAKFLRMRGQDWLEKQDMIDIDWFGICSYVPDYDLQQRIRNRMHNCFIFYP